MCLRFALAHRAVFDGRQRVAVREGLAAGGTDHRVSQVAADVLVADRIPGVLSLRQRPGLDRALNLPEVADAGHLVGFFPNNGSGEKLRGGAGCQVVRLSSGARRDVCP